MEFIIKVSMMEKARYIHVATALCSIVMQNIQIFYGGPVMFIVTCSLWD